MSENGFTLGVVLIGLGGVVAGLAGISLPDGQRLGALFSLISGAGVGLVTLGIGALNDRYGEPSESMFFFASFLGFLTVCATVWLVRRRAVDHS